MIGLIPTQFTAARQKTTEMVTRPTIFCEGVRPSERLWATDSMSSRRPSEPVTSMARTAQTRSGVHSAMSAQVTTTPSRMMTPPIVGVPCLTRWRLGPSARICCPIFSCLMSLMKGGIARTVMRAEIPMERNT